MREIRERGLVRHAAREAERVDERVLVAGVGQEATAAERGPEPRVVDGDDGLEAGRCVALEVDLAVVVARHQPEDIHAAILLITSTLVRDREGLYHGVRAYLEGDFERPASKSKATARRAA